MSNREMHLSEALDFATDLYLAEVLTVNVSSDATPAQVEELLTRWGVRVLPDPTA